LLRGLRLGDLGWQGPAQVQVLTRLGHTFLILHRRAEPVPSGTDLEAYRKSAPPTTRSAIRSGSRVRSTVMRATSGRCFRASTSGSEAAGTVARTRGAAMTVAMSSRK